jgi:YVTN family beta-propeller protein
VAVSPEDTRVYVANSEENLGPSKGSTSVIDTTTGQVIATVPGQGSPSGVAVSPSGTHIYVANYTYPGTVTVITGP